MAGADIRRFAQDRRSLTTTFVFGVIGGALVSLADALLFPSLILAVFVAQLTDDPVTIGLVPAIGTGLWLVAQVIASGLTRGSRRQIPWVTGAAIVRAAAIALLAYIGFRQNMSDSERLRSFFICYGAYAAASGFAAAPSIAVVRRAIPPDRRSGFLRARYLWGAVIAIVAGLVAHRVLGPEGSDFPRNFTFLFVVAAVALSGAVYFLAWGREPARVARTGPVMPGASARQALGSLLDPNYRRFLLFRVILSLAAVADPFYILYAFRELATPIWYVGPYLTALVAARLLTAPLWSALARRAGHRTVLQGAALLRLLAPLVALLLPYLAETDLYRDRFDDVRPLSIAFGAIFVVYGATLAAQSLSNLGYLLAIAPDDRRIPYIRLTNVILAVTALAPIAGGRIIERYGFDRVFLAAAVVSLVAILVSGVLTETHTRTRAVAQAWRLRGARS